MKYVIWDLDNCLSNDAWRIPRIDWAATDPDARYAAYHAVCDEDELYNYMEFKSSTDGGALPVFLTSRPGGVRNKTVAWIQENLGVAEPVLLMRGAGDHRPSVELKAAHVGRLRDMWDITQANITRAYDDRHDICDMYRTKFGISAVVLRIHDVCAYNPPAAKPRAPELLAAGAETFRQRNAVYGDNYLGFGALMVALYPSGLHATTAAEFTRLGLAVMCASKLARYAHAPEGHQDSAHDLMVYAAMLEECTP